MPGKDGTTPRAHAEQVARHTGRPFAEALARLGLAEPDIPPDGALLWSWWRELASGRGNNGFGPLPISWADMDAWARLTGTPLSPWQAGTLRDMDNAFLARVAEQSCKDSAS